MLNAMLNAKSLEHPGIRHGFMTRLGGVSSGLYDSMNCALGSADDGNDILENRRIALGRSGLSQATLVTVAQIHSARVVHVTEPWSPEQAPEADALVTTIPGLALGVLTADCTPVLFADPTTGIIGAAHAGWKGAMTGVLEATVTNMVALGAKTENICAAIGPTIAQASYEVGPELFAAVMDASPWAEDCFMSSTNPQHPEHYQFNLPAYVEQRLAALKLGQVQNLAQELALDTYADKDRFYSYRRTTHQAGSGPIADYGRMLSIIGCPENGDVQ